MATTSGEQAGAVRAPATSRGGAVALLIVANTLWAGTYTAGKVALHELSPVELNALRFSLASLLLLPVLIRGWALIPKDARSLRMIVILVLLGFVLNKFAEYVGLALSTASDVALLIATESLFTALLSWTILHERVTRTGVLALVVGMVGAYLIVARGLVPQFGVAGDTRIWGDILVVLSLLVESGYTVVGKSTLSTLPPLLFTATTLVGSLLFWLPAGAVAVAHSGWPHLTFGGFLAVLYMAAVATVIGYWLWFRALTAIDASAAAPTLFIQPLLGATIAIWLLHDQITAATVIGAALIGVSLFMVVRGARRGGSRADALSAARLVIEEPIP